jgi:hypothetical protein
MGKPVLTFDPYDFGDPWKKKTDLWGEFNLPKKNLVKPLNVKFTLMRSKEIYPEMYGKMSRQERRAITSPGFARAFFEANP